jgi:hypothetical protein
VVARLEPEVAGLRPVPGMPPRWFHSCHAHALRRRAIMRDPAIQILWLPPFQPGPPARVLCALGWRRKDKFRASIHKPLQAEDRLTCRVTEEERTAPRSLGMLGMRERAFLIGARLEIAGSPGQGTEVIIRITLRPHH